MYRKSFCITPGIGVGGGSRVDVSKMLKLYIKVFYVMGKVLLDELPCYWTGLLKNFAVALNFLIQGFDYKYDIYWNCFRGIATCRRSER